MGENGKTALVIAPERNSHIVDHVREEIRVETIITSSDAIDEALATDDADCVIVGSDEADRTRRVVEAVRDVRQTLPIVIVPETGSERLATVALRSGATEYVPLANDDDLGDRVTAAIETADRESPGGADEPHLGLLANSLPDEAFLIDEDGTYLEAQVRPDSADLYTVSADDLTGLHLRDAFPDETAAELLDCIRETLASGDERAIEYEAETTAGTRRFEARVVPLDTTIDGGRAVVWLARDITERAERERALRHRRDQLETFDRINGVVRRVIRTLVEAPTRPDIEREVCEQLVRSDLYVGSWIGEPAGGDDVAYRTGAGEADEYLSRVADVDPDDERPVVTAMRTGEIRATNRLLESASIPDDLQDAIEAEGVRSAIAVPISHDETVYGVLVVVASRSDAFSRREREAFSVLGETIGFTINAVMNRRLLFADSIVELEIRTEDGDTLSFDLSETYDCTCRLEWAGSAANGKTFQYVRVDGVDGRTVIEAAREHDSVEECRLVHDGIDHCTIEVRLKNSGVRTLANHGATIRDVVVRDGVATSTVEVSRDADIRQLLDAVQRVYESAELVAKREVDRPVVTAEERRERLVDTLTDRQLTALRLAYYGGYFDWPRGSTGEEVAEAMDVSPPTMHQHLRKAQRALLDEFFAEGGRARE